MFPNIKGENILLYWACSFHGRDGG